MFHLDINDCSDHQVSHMFLNEKLMFIYFSPESSKSKIMLDTKNSMDNRTHT